MTVTPHLGRRDSRMPMRELQMHWKTGTTKGESFVETALAAISVRSEYMTKLTLWTRFIILISVQFFVWWPRWNSIYIQNRYFLILCLFSNDFIWGGIKYKGKFECFVSRDYINSTLKLKASAEVCPSTLHRYPIVTPSTFRYRVDQFFDRFMDTRPTIDRLIVLIQYQPSIDRNVDRVMTEMSIEDIDREYRSTLDRGWF